MKVTKIVVGFIILIGLLLAWCVPYYYNTRIGDNFVAMLNDDENDENRITIDGIKEDGKLNTAFTHQVIKLCMKAGKDHCASCYWTTWEMTDEQKEEHYYGNPDEMPSFINRVLDIKVSGSQRGGGADLDNTPIFANCICPDSHTYELIKNRVITDNTLMDVVLLCCKELWEAENRGEKNKA